MLTFAKHTALLFQTVVIRTLSLWGWVRICALFKVIFSYSDRKRVGTALRPFWGSQKEDAQASAYPVSFATKPSKAGSVRIRMSHGAKQENGNRLMAVAVCVGAQCTPIWWTRRDSNPRSPRCERGALPAKLQARVKVVRWVHVTPNASLRA